MISELFRKSFGKSPWPFTSNSTSVMVIGYLSCSPAAGPRQFLLLFCDQKSKQKSLFQGEVLPTPGGVGTGQLTLPNPRRMAPGIWYHQGFAALNCALKFNTFYTP